MCGRQAGRQLGDAGEAHDSRTQRSSLHARVLQERLWKQAAALAVGYEVAKLKGKFGLRPPPEGQRRYHEEIVALRVAAAKDSGASDKAGSGRRGELQGRGG